MWAWVYEFILHIDLEKSLLYVNTYKSFAHTNRSAVALMQSLFTYEWKAIDTNCQRKLSQTKHVPNSFLFHEKFQGLDFFLLVINLNCSISFTKESSSNEWFGNFKFKCFENLIIRNKWHHSIVLWCPNLVMPPKLQFNLWTCGKKYKRTKKV